MVVLNDAGSLFGYLDTYRQLMPAPQISGWLAGLDHLLLIGLAGLMIFHPRRRLFACLAFPVFATHLFLQGTKVPNHLFVLIAAYGIHWIYALLDWWDGQHERNLLFLRTMLLVLLMTTYLGAGLAKLNYGFFTLGDSAATSFTWKIVSPFNYLLKQLLGADHPFIDLLWNAYSVVGITTTLIAEIGIPIFLLVRPWRRIGFVLGMFFHLFIIYGTALDFSMTVLPLYLMIATRKEWEGFTACFMRPDRLTVGASALLSVYLLLVHYHLELFMRMPGLGDVQRITHVFFYAYVAFSALRWAMGTAARQRLEAVNDLLVSSRGRAA